MDSQLNQMPAVPQKKNRLVMLLVVGFLVTIVAVLLFVFYNRSPQTPLPAALPLTSPTRPIVEKMEEIQNQLVEGMPEFPLYPGGVIEKSFKRTVGTNNGYIVDMIANASLGDIISFYETELTKDGWTITVIPEERDETGEEAIEATRDNMNVLINLEREDSTTPTEVVIDIFVKNQ